MKKRHEWLLAAAVVLAGGIAGRAESPRPVSAVPGPRAAARGKEVYASAFEKGAGDQWSKKQVTKCPSGRHTFLGPFAYEFTTLSLNNLPEHARMRLSFDLMIMLRWGRCGPTWARPIRRRLCRPSTH